MRRPGGWSGSVIPCWPVPAIGSVVPKRRASSVRSFIHIDPTDDGSVELAAARVRTEYGHLDVLINNAGTAAPRLGAEELTADAATISEGGITNVGCWDGTSLVWPDAPHLAGSTMQLLQ